MMKRPVLLFVDNSNIFIEGQKYARDKKGENNYAFRLNFTHFLYLISRGTFDFDEVVWAGSIPPDNDSIWDKLREKNIEPDLIPRSESGENETVDHLIQLKMYRFINRKYKDQPGTIILCTGDGKGYYNEKGFLYDLEGFIGQGWEFVIYSWTHSCHVKLQEYAETFGKYVPLEGYYNSITFIENERRSTRVDLSSL
jgi:hypothetical protein